MIRFEMGEEVIIKNTNNLFGRGRIIGIRVTPEYKDCPLYTIGRGNFAHLYALDNQQFCKYIHRFENMWCPIFRIYKLEKAQ